MKIGAKAGQLLELCLNAFGPLFAAAWLAGWILKDGTWWSTWCFFIPAVAPVAIGLMWTTATQKQAPKAFRVMVQTVIAIAAAKMVIVDFRWHVRIATPEGTIRVVQWNTARRSSVAEGIFETLKADKPDLCLLSESPRVPNVRELGAKYLDLPYSLDDAGMTLFSRFPMQALGTIDITAGRAWAVRIAAPNGLLDVVAFDLISHPTLDRFTPMRELAAWIRNRKAMLPLIILGDFNTPRDSLSFRPLRQYLKNAHEEAGGGWPYTWPVPLPLYAIDNAWVAPEMKIFNHRHKPSGYSDHLRQVFDVGLPIPQASEPATGADMAVPSPLDSPP